MFFALAYAYRRFTLAAVTVAVTGVLPLAGARTAPSRHRRPKAPAWIAAAQALLNQPDQQRGHWGVYVYSLDQKRVLFNYHGESLFTPASNTKLFTTAAALALIGPDYRFHTSVVSAAAPDAEGIVHGDLVLIGRGDPNLSGRPLPYRYPVSDDPKVLAQQPDLPIEELADQIQQRGVKIVEGGVVGDDSYYSFERFPEGWAQDDLLWGYGAAVSGLCVDDNSILLHVTPGVHAGDPADVQLTPWTGIYHLTNKIDTAPPGTERRLYFDRDPDSNNLVLEGSIPTGDKGDWEALGVQRPALFAARLLKQALERRGIAVYGPATARHAPLPPPPLPPLPLLLPAKAGAVAMDADAASPQVQLADHVSVPLLEDLQLIDKISQNLHAELALRLLGKLKAGQGSLAAGREVRRQFLAQVGLGAHDFYLRDGSGLSRENLVQPSAIVKLLAFMDGQPTSAAWHSLLPIAGVDGSLEDRFKNTPAAGRIQAKTGFVEHVFALSGYATALSGEHLAFSIMVNDDDMPASQVKTVMDEIATSLVTGRATVTVSRK
ncbi:MAG TPA: D-alanyl-D-alanine carboxypeptidase/D-alanyl-D-alanine-endopeptidase [Terriglobales bacterium]|nr:D-alanyl-D-alanine carboxypeptidase/D-alanyl-D-alanine-endopeptidase [Terriglobales bacterium]